MDYLLQEGTLHLSDDFIDRTVNTFSLGSTIPAPLSLTVARDKMLPDEDLSAYLKRQLKLLQSHIKGYKLINQKDQLTLANNPQIQGVLIEAYYKSDGRYYYQKQAAFEILPKKILVFSCTSQEPFTDAQNKLWDDVLERFQLNE